MGTATDQLIQEAIKRTLDLQALIDSVRDHRNLSHIGTKTHDQLEADISGLLAGGGGGGGHAVYPWTDQANGKIYKLVAVDGVLGVEEVASLEIPNQVTDSSTGTTYKIISVNGELGLEEV